MHPVGGDHERDPVRHLSFPLATLLCAVFLRPLPPQLHWAFLCVLALIVTALVLLLRHHARALGN